MTDPEKIPGHPSLEKTRSVAEGSRAPDRVRAEGRAPSRETAPIEHRPMGDATTRDLAFLKDELEKRSNEGATYARTVKDLSTQLEALRSDYSAQRNEHVQELKTLKEAAARGQQITAALESEAAELRTANKQLKAQNLRLQYLSNLWGIPISIGDAGPGEDIEREDGEGGAFFPAITPLSGSADPVQPIVRGDLTSFCFPSLLHFLSTSNLRGVLTIVADRTVTKLYLERAVLKLVGWNNQDPELRLLRLLEEADLVSSDVLERYADLKLFDLDLAARLLADKAAPASVLRDGLCEHARIILGFLFQVTRGSFFFQPGEIPRKRDLQFKLLVTDVLLKTAAEVDEKSRIMVVQGPRG